MHPITTTERTGTLKLRVCGAALFGLLVLAPSAWGSGATITRATYNADYSRGSFAFTANFTDCSGSCTWLPIATVQPSLPSYSCRGDEWRDQDPNTRQVWSGGNQTGNGSVTADLTDVPILTGVPGQRLCVSAVRQRSVQDPVCIAQAPILGIDPSTCPYVNQITSHALGGAILTSAPVAPVGPVGDDACAAAREKLTRARKKLKKLKHREAKPALIAKARRKVQVARGVVKAECQ